MWLLGLALRQIVTVGHLRVIDADGRAHDFKGRPGPFITLRMHDRAIAREIAFNPPLKMGEAYMQGRMTIEGGTIVDFLEFAAINVGVRQHGFLRALELSRIWLRRFHQFNPVPRARANVAHHYDLSGELYRLFLDTDRQYSCAYFATGNDNLEAAQDNKKRHVAAKLHLRPGQSVLDIGSGWGGLAMYLARAADARVTGVTLSEEQHKVANQRAAEAGLAGRVVFHLRDYREQSGPFDRVVSVGMFEHVGLMHYAEFFSKLRDLLAEDGVALLHTIGRADGPGATNPWIKKYIFPGGYSPALSEILPAIEKSGLYVTDVEVLRLHYAETLKEWRRRFMANRDRIKALYDERFCRMWEFYLAGSEMAFRHGGHVVFQIQITRRIDALPLTRDYMFDWERTRMGRARLAV